ncbi:MAG TPA: hypothetical protein VK918_09855 [Pyrinomonadaceae bacterium]|nr:hypothetical protein [Pyrinomonadaceae bacterium]
MKTLTLVTLVILFSVARAGAQDLPFAAFTKAVQEEKGGFAGDKGNLSTIFQAERVRLGPAFESELWKYLADDAEKHYWIGLFLTARSYLHGKDSLPDLAFTIHLRALEILGPRHDPRSLGRRVTINRHLAIASKLAGKQLDAERFRDNAEAIINENDNLSAYIAGQSSYNRCIYQSIHGDITDCKENEAPAERIVARGWLNS